MLQFVRQHKKDKTMKTKILGFILICLITSCKEEHIGQYAVESTPPGKITNPVVQNFKGKAQITYNLPEDKDMLYVKALYTLPSGKQKEKKSSAYVNYIVVDGFAKSGKAQVQLISVDRNYNESEPVNVEIEPDDSPIFDVYESMSAIAGFGGIKLDWENQEKADVVIGVLMKNQENIYEPLDNIYTSVAVGSGSIRGLQGENLEFGLYVRDVFDNYTDTIFTTLTPWAEAELDKSLWRAGTVCSNYFSLSQYGNTNMNILWNGVTYGTNSQATIYYLNRTTNGTDVPIFITFDLGVKAQLSRFKFWGRTEWYFNLHHPKEIEIWGTDDLTVASSDACENWDKWTLLTTCISTKPSGEEALANAQLSTEDMALALAGEEFEFPLTIPSVQYIRFRVLRTWTNSTSMFMGEITFWGNVIE